MDLTGAPTDATAAGDGSNSVPVENPAPKYLAATPEEMPLRASNLAYRIAANVFDEMAGLKPWVDQYFGLFWAHHVRVEDGATPYAALPAAAAQRTFWNVRLRLDQQE
jgi:hypothetical protein